ncbi:MAG: hypothetical protein ACI85Q_001262 [Salibacteraceae bacterium]|jgi:uncharacterized protein (DUF2141 family)
MRNLFVTIILTCAAFFANAQNTLTVHITNLKTNSGTVYLSLSNNGEEVVKKTKGTVTNKVCTLTLEDLVAGTYAVTYFHDENDNSKMDTGMFGKPEEGYGYSNDARGFMGPADFEDQLFEIKSDLKITLTTVH